MALPTFVPPRPPGAIADKPEVNIVKFERGDGYTSSSPNGLNHIRRVLSMTWRYLTVAQADELERFLRERGGYKPFAWKPSLEAVPLIWTCEEWAIDTQPKAWRQLNATFRQSYTLEI